MAGLTGILTVVLLAGPQLRIMVRGGASGDGVVELDMQNASGRTLEGPAEVSLELRPLDRAARPLFGGTLWSSVDPIRGEFGGRFAAERAYPPASPNPTLRLEANERRTIVIRLTALRWSLSPQWVEQPREFWELAGHGDYSLWAHLILFDDKVTYTSAPEVKVRIAGH